MDRWLLAGVVALASARAWATSQSSPKSTPVAGQAATQSPGTIGKARLADDPKEDGWISETIDRRTSKTMKKWAASVANNAPFEAADLEHYAAPDFEVGRLRPDALATTFGSAGFAVRRPTAESLAAAHATIRHGAAGLKEALDELFAPLADAASRRTAVKTIFIEDEETPPRTFVRVETLAKRKGGSVQQISHWWCRWQLPEGDAPGLLLGIELESFEEAELAQPTATLFSDCTIAALGGNPCFERQLVPRSDEWLGLMDQRIGYDTRGHQGVTIGDVNGDGLEDLYVCQAGGLPNRLFLHQPDGTAKDFSAESGTDWIEPSHSSLLVDLDDDGDQDLVVGIGFELMVMANDGAGHFLRVADLPLTRPSTSLAAADCDDDGDIDLYACVFYDKDHDPGALAHPLPLNDATNGGRNCYYRNDTPKRSLGGATAWKFTDATTESGLDEHNDRWSWACAFEDYDNDGDQDLYVANDFGRNNLYRNDGGRFHDVADALGASDPSFSMGCTWGDYDRDGSMDLHVSDMWSSAGHRVAFQAQFHPGATDEQIDAFRYLARGDTLLKNRGGRFEDVSVASGITMGRWAWGSFFLDADDDGWEDVLVCNGYLTNTEPDDL